MLLYQLKPEEIARLQASVPAASTSPLSPSSSGSSPFYLLDIARASIPSLLQHFGRYKLR
jgi:hypothetical protein